MCVIFFIWYEQKPIISKRRIRRVSKTKKHRNKVNKKSKSRRSQCKKTNSRKSWKTYAAAPEVIKTLDDLKLFVNEDKTSASALKSHFDDPFFKEIKNKEVEEVEQLIVYTVNKKNNIEITAENELFIDHCDLNMIKTVFNTLVLTADSDTKYVSIVMQNTENVNNEINTSKFAPLLYLLIKCISTVANKKNIHQYISSTQLSKSQYKSEQNKIKEEYTTRHGRRRNVKTSE